jgi:hypothetical protein
MYWIDRLNTAPRVVVVVALGLALGIVASYLTGLGTRLGWYGYAPLSGQAFQPQGLDDRALAEGPNPQPASSAA